MDRRAVSLECTCTVVEAEADEGGYFLPGHHLIKVPPVYHHHDIQGPRGKFDIFGPTSSHIYPTGQNEVPLEPQRPNEDFGVSHTQIKHS